MNLTPDDCDIEDAASEDYNGNGIPDECECFEANCPLGQNCDGEACVTTQDPDIQLGQYWNALFVPMGEGDVYTAFAAGQGFIDSFLSLRVTGFDPGASVNLTRSIIKVDDQSCLAFENTYQLTLTYVGNGVNEFLDHYIFIFASPEDVHGALIEFHVNVTDIADPSITTTIVQTALICIFGVCDDGLFCNGAESCGLGGGCLAGASPCGPDEICIEDADQCELDCNGNGILDGCDTDCGPPSGACDVAGCGMSKDCNDNGTPDECTELEGDCNDNGTPDDCETDDDGDGVINDCDLCPDTPIGWPVESDGCSSPFGACCFPNEVCINNAEIDDCVLVGGSFLGPTLSCDEDEDGDGATGCDDGCPFDSGKVTPGICGCGMPDADDDNDGVVDCVDACLGTELGLPVNECGCAALGACCFTVAKVCFDETLSEDCVGIGGAYQGDGALCDDGCVFGDFDDDGDVDLIDFGVFQSCLADSSGGEIGPECERGDIDGCGVIDLFDFAAFNNVVTGP